MKSTTTSTFAVLSILISSFTFFTWQGYSQCVIGSSYGAANAPVSYGLTSTLTTCSFGDEYSTATNCAAGVDYEVTYTGGTGNYVTIYDNTNTAVAWGLSPVTFTATYSGTYYSQGNLSAVCDVESVCHTAVWEYVAPVPTCPDPNNGTISSITSSTAELSWVEAGAATAWDIELGATPFAPTGIPTASVSVTPAYSQTGLSNSTSYAFYVRADCSGAGNGTSGWVGPFSFTTAACDLAIDNVAGASPTTFGGSDGSASVSVSNVSGNLSYVWNPAGSLSTISGLTAGTYNVIVSDDISAACSVTGSVTIVDPAPANDNCSSAQPIFCGDALAGQTYSAIDDAPFITGQGLNGCTSGLATVTSGVWYKFTGTGDDIEASTCSNADYDTRISVYSGSCGILACVAGNDDAPTCAGYTSVASFGTSVGVDYYIFIHGYGNAQADQGAFTLSLTCSTPCTPVPSNDDCVTASSLSVSSAGGCTPTAGSNLCAANASIGNPSCDPFGVIQDVWYTFNTGVNSGVSIDLQAVSANPNGLKMALYDGCGGNEVSCFNGVSGIQSVTGLTAGTDYYLQIWTGSTDEGDFTICISEPSCNVLANVNVSPATSAGGSNGAANATITGAQGNISYIWSTAETTVGITGLTSGTYTVTVSDDVTAGCSATASALVTDPSVTVSCSLTAAINGIDPSAYNAFDGSVTAVPSGNQGNIGYLWDAGSTNQVQTNLGGGVYVVTITDDITAGCSATASLR